MYILFMCIMPVFINCYYYFMIMDWSYYINYLAVILLYYVFSFIRHIYGDLSISYCSTIFNIYIALLY
jgi:hypothetical protein